MKKIILGMALLTSISTFASEFTKKCHVYQFVSESSYSRYEKIDTLDLNARTSEYGRPIKGLDNVGLRIRKSRTGTMNILLVEGHSFIMPSKKYAEISANISQRPLEILLSVKEDMLSINCGEIE